jgi:hypothetical protein
MMESRNHQRPQVNEDEQEDNGVQLVHSLLACGEAVQHGDLVRAEETVCHIQLLASPPGPWARWLLILLKRLLVAYMVALPPLRIVAVAMLLSAMSLTIISQNCCISNTMRLVLISNFHISLPIMQSWRPLKVRSGSM